MIAMTEAAISKTTRNSTAELVGMGFIELSGNDAFSVGTFHLCTWISAHTASARAQIERSHRSVTLCKCTRFPLILRKSDLV